MPGGDGTGKFTGGRGRSQGGIGRMGGPKAAGPDGVCVCPSCGHQVRHLQGHPCNNRSCPKCGSKMTRN